MKQKCIIVDIDGTLAICGDRDTYDFTKCDTDYLSMPIAEIVNVFFKCKETYIFIVTGRGNEHRGITEKWLQNYRIHYNALYMRPDMDDRTDIEIKQEIFDQYIAEKYDVLFVLEDKDESVRLYREELNLPCLQVNYGKS